MTVTSEGKELVWALFDNDGCECSDLVGVFDSHEKAEEAKNRIEPLIRKFYVQHMTREWNGSLSISCLTIGEYELPSKAQYVLEGATS